VLEVEPYQCIGIFRQVVPFDAMPTERRAAWQQVFWALNNLALQGADSE